MDNIKQYAGLDLRSGHYEVEIHDFELPIKTDEQLRSFLYYAFGVVLPDHKCCANHSTPWQAFRDAYFAVHPVSVWKASRGFGGKTFTLALLALTEALTLGADVNILGGSGEQSNRVHENTKLLWDHKYSPKEYLLSDPITSKTRFVWGNSMRALLASQRSVRGPHPQRLRMDEIDEMDIKILDSAMGQPMSKNGILSQTVLSSTHQYPAGTMTEILHRANDQGWPVYEWCYKETVKSNGGWLDDQDLDRKRTEVTKLMWQIEYDLQEPSSDDFAIYSDKVDAMFNKDLGYFDGKPREIISVENYVQGARYVIGGDWAKKMDWTIIIVMRVDVNPWRIVYFERRGREPWPNMVKAYDNAYYRYHVERGMHDATGVGDVVDDYLEVNAEGQILVGKLRTDILSTAVTAIENGEIESPYIKHMRDELRYASYGDVYGTRSQGHLPDTLSALATAIWCEKEGGASMSDFDDLGSVDDYDSRWR